MDQIRNTGYKGGEILPYYQIKHILLSYNYKGNQSEVLNAERKKHEMNQCCPFSIESDRF